LTELAKRNPPSFRPPRRTPPTCQSHRSNRSAKARERVDFEGEALPGGSDRIAQIGGMIDKQVLAPVEEIDREKPATSWNERMVIVRPGPADARACVVA
jgi:hypothetical protein